MSLSVPCQPCIIPSIPIFMCGPSNCRPSCSQFRLCSGWSAQFWLITLLTTSGEGSALTLWCWFHVLSGLFLCTDSCLILQPFCFDIFDIYLYRFDIQYIQFTPAVSAQTHYQYTWLSDLKLHFSDKPCSPTVHFGVCMWHLVGLNGISTGGQQTHPT